VESARAEYVVDRVDAEGYEPDIVDGIQVGEFRGLEPKGASANELDVSVLALRSGDVRLPVRKGRGIPRRCGCSHD
jgi:hypothetical protein